MGAVPGSGYPRLVATTPTSTRPARGAELELTVDTLAHGGNGVARLDGYVVFVAGALPGDRVRAVVGKSKRAYAEARAVEILEPSPDRIAPKADHPGAPWQVLSYDRQLEVKAEQVGDALRRIGRLDGFEQDPIVPAVEQWRYRNKLEYSFGADAQGELVCGFHAPGRFDEIVAARRLPARVRARQRGARPGAGMGAGAGPLGLGPARPARAAAQPRRPRGAPHRRAAGPARHVARRDRQGQPRRRGRLRGPVLDAGRGPRREHAGRRDHTDRRLQAPARGALRARVPDLARGVLPDQHRDGRGALRRGRRAGRSARPRARLRPLLRHRHDRPLARGAGARGGRRRDRRGAPSRTRSTTPAATRSPTRASSPATSASRCATSSRRPASRTSA